MSESASQRLHVIRTDFSGDSGAETFQFFQAETLRLQFIPGSEWSNRVPMPTDGTCRMEAWIDGTPGTLYVSKVGVVDSSSDRATIDLSRAESNMPVGTYLYVVKVFDADDTQTGVVANGSFVVNYSPDTDSVSYVGTSPSVSGANVSYDNATSGLTATTVQDAIDELEDEIDGVGGSWGSITGTLADQTDLQTALDGKQDELTDAEIKTAYEANADTNAFTDSDQALLASATQLGGWEVWNGVDAVVSGSKNLILNSATLPSSKTFSGEDFATSEFLNLSGALFDLNGNVDQIPLYPGDYARCSVVSDNVVTAEHASGAFLLRGFSIVPNSDNAVNLGSATERWRRAYAIFCYFNQIDALTTSGLSIRNSLSAEKLKIGADTGADVQVTGSASVSGELKANNYAINPQTGTTYTLVIGDAGLTVTMANSSANNLTIPTNASVAFSVGTVINVLMKGSGTTAIAGDTGVTVNGTSAGSVDISAQWQGASLLKVATDDWIVSGAIA